MKYCKEVKVPIPVGTQLSANQCAKLEEIEYMYHVAYASAVGSLMYAKVCTQPDIAHAVEVLRRYMMTPRKEHWTTIKRVFRYLHGMTNFAIYYHGNSKDVGVHDFVDSDWAGDIHGIRSTNDYVFGLFGGAISWMSRK